MAELPYSAVLTMQNRELDAENQRLMAENKRYREALEFLEPCARELVAVAAVETEAYRRRWRMAIEQARAVVNALDATEAADA